MYPLDAVGEGLRNLRAGTGRPVVTTIALLACAAVLLGLELGSLKALLESARAFRAAGGAVTILKTRGQVDGAACHALGGISGIDAAAVTITGLQVRSAQLPQQPLPLVRATSGLADLLGITPNGVGVWISTDTAEQLGVDVGSPLVLDGQATRVAAIFDYPDDGRRPVLGYAIVEPAIAMGPFDECWGSSWPMNPGIQPLLLSSAYLPAVEQGQVRFSQLNGTLGVGFDGSEQFLRRPTSWSWLARGSRRRLRSGPGRLALTSPRARLGAACRRVSISALADRDGGDGRCPGDRHQLLRGHHHVAIAVASCAGRNGVPAVRRKNRRGPSLRLRYWDNFRSRDCARASPVRLLQASVSRCLHSQARHGAESVT